MKRYILLVLLVLLGIPSFGAEDGKVINVRTDNSSLIICVDKDGFLRTLHYGGVIEDTSPFADFQFGISKGHGSVYETYSTQGGRGYNEPALAVTHKNGDLNTELRYISHNTEMTENGNVDRTIIHLADLKEGLAVDLIYKAYMHEDVIVVNSIIRNDEKGTVMLRNYYSAALPIRADKYLLTHLYGSWAHEARVQHTQLVRGTMSVESRKGVRTTHTENPSFMLSLNTDSFSEDTGEVIAGSLAWSGNFKLNFELTEFNVLNVLAGANPYSATRWLARGESFETPELILTWSGQGAGRASRNLHRWAREYKMHCGYGMTPTLLNSWEGAYFTFDASVLKEMVDDAADMGLEMFVLDDGWFGNKYPRNNAKAGLGDWQVNVSKLPEGIDDIASYTHSRGLKFGIWIEPEMVNPKSELYEKHPEWIVRDRLHEPTTMRNQYLLDLTRREVQDFVFDVFDKTMTLSDKIDYIKWDANRHVENVGSLGLPSDRQTEFWVDYTKGFYNVVERLRSKYPSVMIQACSSGGGRVEYGALKYFDEFWTSDDTEALVRTGIQYGTSLFFPANVMGSHVSAVPNHQTGNITPIKFRFDVACAGRLGMELQPKDMTETEKAFAQKAISSYKDYRDIIAEGDLYRLGAPEDKSGTYALMYVSRDRRRAVLFTYCLSYDSRYSVPQFRLAGLDENMNYHVTELNVEKSASWFAGKSLSGEFLMKKGVNPPLKKVYESAVFLLEGE